MATYKVLQDIEAEDTLIGPLTLRQCIYAAIAVIAIYLSVVFVSKHVAFMVLFTLPFIAFGIFFAFPWSKQQSTEVWALAKVRFMLKPRKRIWNQSGVKNLVTITVPKNLKRSYTSNLTPAEVNSRLKALADTIDSRGWAVKNVDLGYYTKPSVLGGTTSDRLVSQANLPQEVPPIDVTAAEDIFDVHNNPIAQKFDAMMSQSAGAHHQQLMQQMVAPQPQVTPLGQPVQPTALWHMRTIAPLQTVAATQTSPVGAQVAPGVQPAMASPIPALTLPAPMSPNQPLAGFTMPAYTTQNPVTAPPNPAILELANNNDLDIATIAREAQVRNPAQNGEVTISLH